jgi:hypothetical protein
MVTTKQERAEAREEAKEERVAEAAAEKKWPCVSLVEGQIINEKVYNTGDPITLTQAELEKLHAEGCQLGIAGEGSPNKRTHRRVDESAPGPDE